MENTKQLPSEIVGYFDILFKHTTQFFGNVNYRIINTFDDYIKLAYGKYKYEIFTLVVNADTKKYRKDKNVLPFDNSERMKTLFGEKINIFLKDDLDELENFYVKKINKKWKKNRFKFMLEYDYAREQLEEMDYCDFLFIMDDGNTFTLPLFSTYVYNRDKNEISYLAIEIV